MRTTDTIQRVVTSFKINVSKIKTNNLQLWNSEEMVISLKTHRLLKEADDVSVDPSLLGLTDHMNK